MPKIKIWPVPGESFGIARAKGFVPTELTERPVLIEVPMHPRPMFRRVCQCGVEGNAYNRLPTDIPDANVDPRRVELQDIEWTNGMNGMIRRNGLLLSGKRKRQDNEYGRKAADYETAFHEFCHSSQPFPNPICKSEIPPCPKGLLWEGRPSPEVRRTSGRLSAERPGGQ